MVAAGHRVPTPHPLNGRHASPGRTINAPHKSEFQSPSRSPACWRSASSARHYRHYSHHYGNRAALRAFGLIAGTIASIASAEEARRDCRRYGYCDYGYGYAPPPYDYYRPRYRYYYPY
jgi:hypothetical protein